MMTNFDLMVTKSKTLQSPTINELASLQYSSNSLLNLCQTTFKSNMCPGSSTLRNKGPVIKFSW